LKVRKISRDTLLTSIKKLFGKPDVTNMHINDVGIGRLGDEDCELLKKDFIWRN
jgi:hypothetical protein